jgi:hypothetical protein
VSLAPGRSYMLSGRHMENVMANIVARVIPYSEDQEHILRRLGGAVVAQWAALPSEVQDLILMQAPLIHDRDECAQAYQQIDAFIQLHQGDMRKG